MSVGESHQRVRSGEASDERRLRSDRSASQSGHSHRGERRPRRLLDARLARFARRGALLGLIPWLLTSYWLLSNPFPIKRPAAARRGAMPVAGVVLDAETPNAALVTALYCLPLWLLAGGLCGAITRVVVSRRWDNSRLVPRFLRVRRRRGGAQVRLKWP